MTAIKYIIFAIVSTLFNLFFQYLSFSVYQGFLSLYVGMACGTMAGLITKYILDKKYIFYHQPKSKKEDAQKFMLYSLMGVITTFIFWGTEITFDYVFATEIAKYVGAIIGLSIGYVAKYFLDKRFVFKEAS